MLRDRPDHEVRNIISRLRAGANIESLVRFVETGDMLLQLHAAPDDARLIEALEDLLSVAALDGPPNPYHASRVYLARFSEASKEAQATGEGSEEGMEEDIDMDSSEGTNSDLEQGPAMANKLKAQMETSKEEEVMYNTSFNQVKLINSNLNAAKPSEWTSVISDNGLMRRLLNDYFLHDFPFAPVFHMDSFLDDMAHGRGRFCSPLLVNSVLAAACHRLPDLVDRANYSNPQNLGYKFQSEARRLWDLETKPTICSVQSGVMLYFVYNQSGTDKAGWPYLKQATVIAQELGLFDKYLHQDRSWQIVQDLTVWGLFGVQSVYCFHFEVRSLVPETPTLPPRDDPAEYGDIVVQYPNEASTVTIALGLMSKVRKDLHILINELSRDSRKTNLSQSEALGYLDKLRLWFDALPAVLTPENVVLPIHLQIHLHYHNVVVSLLEPFLGSRRVAPLKDDETSTEAVAIIRQAVDSSKTSLQFLIRLYYRCHGSDTACIAMVQFLMFIAFSALTDIRERQGAEIRPPIRSPSPLASSTSSSASIASAQINQSSQALISQQEGKQRQLEGQSSTHRADTNTDIALHSTIILCGLMLHRLGRNFAIAGAIFRLLRSRLCSDDRARLEHAARIPPSWTEAMLPIPGRGADDESSPQVKPPGNEIRSEWLVNHDGRARDERRLEFLLDKYANMSIAEEMGRERTSGSSAR